MILQMLVFLAGLSPQADLHALADDFRRPSKIEADEDEIRFALGNNEMRMWEQFGGFGFHDKYRNPGATPKWADWTVRHLGRHTGGYAPADIPEPAQPPVPRAPKDPPSPPAEPVPEPATMFLLAAGAIPLLRRR
jgi:hypothetical protein